MPAPTAQAHDADWFDDPLIANDDVLIRVVKTERHIVLLEDGTYGVSPQLWTSQKGGCSVDLNSLAAAAGETPGDRVVAHKGLGAKGIGVEGVRSTMNRIDQSTKKPCEPLGVAHTPIGTGGEYPPNPYHCDIFPQLGNPGRNKLHSKAHTLVELDQAMAASIYAARHGVKPS